MRNINSSRLTKEKILEKVSQITIFATYLGIPIEIIQSCIDTGELICNPLRIDNHPTAGFRYNNRGKLKFRDFGNDQFWGDCFDVVALVMSNIYNKSYDVSDKNDFIKILRHITLTFKDIFYGKEKDINLLGEINIAIENIKHRKPVIELVVREWNNNDKEYWGQFGIPLQLLNINFVYPIDQYYINRKTNPEPKYFYNKKDPCYGYNLGRDKSGVYSIKLYFPNRDKTNTRFITNCNHLEGIYNLDRNDYSYVVITKSTKDRLSIIAAVNRMHSLYGRVVENIGNIGVINIPHETYRLRQNEYDWLRSKLIDGGKIISIMDNDRTGKGEALWLRNCYEVIPLLIPKETGAKDFAELVKKTNDTFICNLITKAISYINKYERKNDRVRRHTGKSDTLPY